ncbi:hypothetical protein LMG26788_02151 [Achromobacter pulmonis]|uniref:Uncharacterized protein n=1 Tax=Achromobacter pulmonis TaxID=1389932 RepID=A0A6S7D3M2_9BURK|nr:O-methyltransferase [Achromobacter pulmonis]CAB3858820.1 hypothetical protein LMG26788_02151 [Achromobacter pulmonis]
MSSTPSFHRFDYLLRTNKHIERKLVFDILDGMTQQINFDQHWYLGFGSMWFGDFRLAHRRLGINRMVSVEYPEHATRAEFNRPFAGVRVEPGDCRAVISEMTDDTWAKPVIAWLDYDGYLNDDVVGDIDILLSRAQLNSVVVVTVNGARATYRARQSGAIRARGETAIGVVESFLGAGCIPPRFQPTANATGNHTEASETDFPEFLTEAITSYMEHHLVSLARQEGGSRLKFLPLYRLHHRDGADMVTVGGAIVNEETEELWKRCLTRQPLLAMPNGQPTYCRLDLIPVTVKEKIALDACLPDIGDGTEFFAAVRAAGVALPEAELSKYRKFYQHFPVFVESSI